MKFEQLVVLLPCHSLEDLSLSREAAEAEQLLSAWSALFHPLLLGTTGSLPQWVRADCPPEDPAGKLIIVPHCCEGLLPPDWFATAEAAGAVIVQGEHRQQMIAAALGYLDDPIAPVDPDLAADFLALGFCYFLVELLTRQLRYMSNLDEAQFRQRTLKAAEEALGGSAESARDYLRSAFDLLTESREYFYPVETHLLDLTLVVPTTLGRSLRGELSRPGPINLLMSGKTLEQMVHGEPETLALLREALEKRTATVVGGEWEEVELPLLPLEAIVAQLRRGLDGYQRHLGSRPTIFARRRFGLTPVLPRLLRKLGFVGACHFTLDDGRFPTGNQSKVRWEGLDGTPLESLARLPIDVTRPECFLRLPEKLGQTMDLDHAASAVFAHWPGQSSPWYEDLRRMGRYSPALGRFESLTDYFGSTEYAGQSTRHKPDQYRSPYLRQDVAAGRPDPISRWVRYYGRRAVAETAQTLETMAQVLTGRPLPSSESAEEMLWDVETARNEASPAEGDLDRRLQARLDEAKQLLVAALAQPGEERREGCLILHPASFSVRRCVDVSELAHPPAQGGAVWRTAVQQAVAKGTGVVLSSEVEAPSTAGKDSRPLPPASPLSPLSSPLLSAVVDLPAMGFVWLEAGPELPSPPPASRKKKGQKQEEPPLAEGNLLRNEFFQVELNPVTGAIQSIRDFFRGGNRLAQQLAYRASRPLYSGQAERGDDDDACYTIMAADEIAVVSPGPLVGETQVRGRLVDREGQLVARFVETFRVERGSRVLELEIELEPLREPEGDPWNSYYAARFAWADATTDLYRSVHLACVPSEAVQLEAPHFLELRQEKRRTTILTGGLPYHRRFGLRKLDTLLMVRGESARRFRMAVGIDLPYPVPAAVSLLAPEVVVRGAARPPTPSGWLFHVSAKNVVATAWEPIVSEDRVSGFRVRLLETEGCRSALVLRAPRRVKSARKIDFGSSDPVELPVTDDQVTIEIGAHEWVEVEVDGGWWIVDGVTA